jgi:hypothetical protein
MTPTTNTRPTDAELVKLLREAADWCDSVVDGCYDIEAAEERVAAFYAAADALAASPRASEGPKPNELMDILDTIDGDGVVVTDYEVAIPALRAALRAATGEGR